MFDINNWEFRWSSDCESKIEREHESLPVIDDNETLWNLLVAVRGLNLINRFEVCSPSSHIWVTLTQTKCWNSQQTFFYSFVSLFLKTQSMFYMKYSTWEMNVWLCFYQTELNSGSNDDAVVMHRYRLWSRCLGVCFVVSDQMTQKSRVSHSPFSWRVSPSK